jgi:hypothetical protein
MSVHFRVKLQTTTIDKFKIYKQLKNQMYAHAGKKLHLKLLNGIGSGKIILFIGFENNFSPVVIPITNIVTRFAVQLIKNYTWT